MVVVGLGMVLHLSVNMVESTINPPLKKFFLFIHMFQCGGGGGGIDVIGYYVLKRTSFVLFISCELVFNSEKIPIFLKSNYLESY